MLSYKTLAAAAAAGLLARTIVPAAAAENAIVPPSPLETPTPDVPKNRFGLPIEGFVKVHYTVRPDGTPADVRVVDSAPAQLSAELGVRAVEQWRFKPATADGKPIEWDNTFSTVEFDDRDVPFEFSPFFSAGYKKAQEAVKKKDYKTAKRVNDLLLENVTTRLREIGVGETQAAIIDLGLGDPHSALTAIRRATDPNVVVMTPDELHVALQYRFAIELDLGRVMQALATFDRINAIKALPATDPTARQAAALKKALQGGDAIAVQARVDGRTWEFQPTRRTVTITKVDGKIDTLHFECDRRKADLPFKADSEWKLPASWGACDLLVDAKRGTTFTLYEFK